MSEPGPFQPYKPPPPSERRRQKLFALRLRTGVLFALGMPSNTILVLTLGLSDPLAMFWSAIMDGPRPGSARMFIEAFPHLFLSALCLGLTLLAWRSAFEAHHEREQLALGKEPDRVSHLRRGFPTFAGMLFVLNFFIVASLMGFMTLGFAFEWR